MRFIGGMSSDTALRLRESGCHSPEPPIWFRSAYRAGTGVVAFNVITLEHAEAIIAGAERAGSPVILQISENTVKFHHGRLRPIAAATAAVAAQSTIAVSVHLDHVEAAAPAHGR